MTIAVYWEVKQQLNKNKQNLHSVIRDFLYEIELVHALTMF